MPRRPEPTLGELYPTGRRNFVRVFPADDLQGVAFAQFARERDAGGAFVLDDGSPGYGYLIAAAFAATASGSGIESSAGRAGTPRAPRTPGSPPGSARRRADAVMRQRDSAQQRRPADPRPPRRARPARRPDGAGRQFGPPAANLLDAAGRAARGVFISYSGVPIERLPDRAAGSLSASRARSRASPSSSTPSTRRRRPRRCWTRSSARTAPARRARRARSRRRSADGLIGEVRFDAAGRHRPRRRRDPPGRRRRGRGELLQHSGQRAREPPVGEPEDDRVTGRGRRPDWGRRSARRRDCLPFSGVRSVRRCGTTIALPERATRSASAARMIAASGRCPGRSCARGGRSRRPGPGRPSARRWRRGTWPGCRRYSAAGP